MKFFFLESNPSSANEQSFSNVVCQTDQNKSSDSSPDTENETKVKTKLKNFVKHPMKTGLNQQDQRYSKYLKFRLNGRSHFLFHFIHLEKMVGCISYDQNMGKKIIFGDLMQ